MGRVYKHGTSWWIDYRWPPGRGGERIRERVGPVKDEARILLARRLEDIRQGCDPTLRRIRPRPFSEVAEEFLDRYAARLRSHDTLARQVKTLRGFFDGRTLQEITPHLITEYVSGRLRGGVSGSTTNRERAALSSIFNRAKTWGYYAAPNPVSDVRPEREPKGRLRFLTAAEEVALRECAAEHMKAYALLGCRTGGRDSELRALRWDDIDLERGLVVFQAANTKSGEQREVPASPELLAYLRERYKGRPRWRAGVEHVLYYRGEPLGSVRTAFGRACRRAGLGPDVTPHTLRHTFASWFMQNGGDLYRLQVYMGHSDIKLTQRYAHLSPSWLQEGAAFIGPPKTAPRAAEKGV